MTINLNTVTWEDAPQGFDQSGTLYNTKLASLSSFDGFFARDIGGFDTILALNTRTLRASMAVGVGEPVSNSWAESHVCHSWELFDHWFGRAHWQSWLAEWETETAALLRKEMGSHFAADEDLDIVLKETTAPVTYHSNGRWSAIFSISDYMEQVVIPALGDQADDFHVGDIAVDMLTWHDGDATKAGGLLIRPGLIENEDKDFWRVAQSHKITES